MCSELAKLDLLLNKPKFMNVLGVSYVSSFLIVKCCLFIVAFKMHPVMPVALFGVQVQNTMYSITCSFCLKRRTNTCVGVA